MIILGRFSDAVLRGFPAVHRTPVRCWQPAALLYPAPWAWGYPEAVRTARILGSRLITGQDYKNSPLLRFRMKYRDLRDFMAGLEKLGELRRVREPVSARLENRSATSCCAGGPALFFGNSCRLQVSGAANLFGTPRRVALGMGATEVNELREVGQLLARLASRSRARRASRGSFTDGQGGVGHKPAVVRRRPARRWCWKAPRVDLGQLPVQTCWPGDVGR